MQSDGFSRHLLIAFGLALTGYVLMYGCDRHLRARKGAWEFTFAATATGEPVLTIDQAHYGIRKVRVVIENQHYEGPTKRLRFDKPGLELPFGKPVFFDTTFLPGSVTLDLYGHEVEVLPRTLIVNFKELPWVSGQQHSLAPEEAWSVKATNKVEQVPALKTGP
ncbi:MAG: hypothetical protein P8L18_04635 [Verrucomicrobiota bacterium]|nr:hypothetical protein [Verrucomicrobiota bacterium]